jgi:tryptophan synthase alpha subunit
VALNDSSPSTETSDPVSFSAAVAGADVREAVVVRDAFVVGSGCIVGSAVVSVVGLRGETGA